MNDTQVLRYEALAAPQIYIYIFLTLSLEQGICIRIWYDN